MAHLASGVEPRRRWADPNTGFAWLRMIGSFLVVIEHCAPLTDPSQLTLLPESWGFSPGYTALMGFFAMSGFQIADSWQRDPCWWRFAGKRVLRIWPPLLTVVIVTALVIGPLATTLSVREYFSSSATWGYIVNNAGLYTLQHPLPGVFENNPYSWSANGSLWTLPMELTGYLIVLGLGLVAGFTRYRWLAVVVLIALVAFDRRFEASIGDPGTGGGFLSVPIGSAVAFLVAFVVGVMLVTYRDSLALSPAVAWALVGMQAAVVATEVGPFTLPFVAGYGAVVLAHHWPRRLEGHDRWVYGSYGLYIWAFPLQQLLIMAGLDSQWSLTLAAVPAAYVAGLLSWRYVEEPTMSLRRYLAPRRRKRRAPTPPATVGTVPAPVPIARARESARTSARHE